MTNRKKPLLMYILHQEGSFCLSAKTKPPVLPGEIKSFSKNNKPLSLVQGESIGKKSNLQAS